MTKFMCLSNARNLSVWYRTPSVVGFRRSGSDAYRRGVSHVPSHHLPSIGHGDFDAVVDVVRHFARPIDRPARVARSSSSSGCQNPRHSSRPSIRPFPSLHVDRQASATSQASVSFAFATHMAIGCSRTLRRRLRDVECGVETRPMQTSFVSFRTRIASGFSPDGLPFKRHE